MFVKLLNKYEINLSDQGTRNYNSATSSSE